METISCIRFQGFKSVVLWGPNGPHASGKRRGNYLYISIQKRPVYYADNWEQAFCKEDQVERAYLW